MEAGIKGLFKDKGKEKGAGKKPISESSCSRSSLRPYRKGQLHALECAKDDRGDGRQLNHRAAHQEGERAQAASHAPSTEKVRDNRPNLL
jgi:hypothetical protein